MKTGRLISNNVAPKESGSEGNVLNTKNNQIKNPEFNRG